MRPTSTSARARCGLETNQRRWRRYAAACPPLLRVRTPSSPHHAFLAHRSCSGVLRSAGPVAFRIRGERLRGPPQRRTQDEHPPRLGRSRSHQPCGGSGGPHPPTEFAFSFKLLDGRINDHHVSVIHFSAFQLIVPEVRRLRRMPPAQIHGRATQQFEQLVFIDAIRRHGQLHERLA